MLNEGKVCKFCGEDLDDDQYHFECHINNEDYCNADCCIDDLRQDDTIAVGEDGGYYCNCEFYEYTELVKEIGEWV